MTPRPQPVHARAALPVVAVRGCWLAEAGWLSIERRGGERKEIERVRLLIARLRGEKVEPEAAHGLTIL
jgi:hypothetical protein